MANPEPPSSRRAWGTRMLPAVVAISNVRLALSALAVLAVSSCGLQEGVAQRPANSQAQTQAPPISAALLDGGSLDWSALRGHPIVLDFWASWCGPCRAEQADLNALHSQYASHGVAFIGVDVRDDNAQALAFRHDLQVLFPSVVDADEQISAAYDVAAPPTIVVIDSRGTIVDRLLGTVVGLGDDLARTH